MKSIVYGAIFFLLLLFPAAPGFSTAAGSAAPQKLISAALPEDFPPVGGPMGENEPYAHLPELKKVTLEELMRYDPATVPNDIIWEKEWDRWQRDDIFILIQMGMRGNPAALARLGRGFSIGTHSTQTERLFWLRQADILTRPGWAMRILATSERRKISSAAADFGDPHALHQESLRYEFTAAKAGHPSAMGEAAVNMVKLYPQGYYAWSREAGMRGNIFAWVRLGAAYMDTNQDIEGISLDPVKAYAMLQLAATLPVVFPVDGTVQGSARGLLTRLSREAMITPDNLPQAQAAAEALREEYDAYQARVLAEQRERQERMLPHVQAAIREWLGTSLDRFCGEDENMCETFYRQYTRRQFCDGVKKLQSQSHTQQEGI